MKINLNQGEVEFFFDSDKSDSVRIKKGKTKFELPILALMRFSSEVVRQDKIEKINNTEPHHLVGMDKPFHTIRPSEGLWPI